MDVLQAKALASNLRSEGWSYDAIAEATGYARSSIRCWLDSDQRARQMARKKAARRTSGILPRSAPNEYEICGEYVYINLGINGVKTVINVGDFAIVKKMTWRLNSAGYAVSGSVRMHRIIIDANDGFEVDHIDGDRLNNRRSNLRICTTAQNQWNRGAPRSNTSGFKGVSFNKTAQKWVAIIQANGRSRYLGRFDTPEQGHAAYAAASLALHGEFSRAK